MVRNRLNPISIAISQARDYKLRRYCERYNLDDAHCVFCHQSVGFGYRFVCSDCYVEYSFHQKLNLPAVWIGELYEVFYRFNGETTKELNKLFVGREASINVI